MNEPVVKGLTDMVDQCTKYVNSRGLQTGLVLDEVWGWILVAGSITGIEGGSCVLEVWFDTVGWKWRFTDLGLVRRWQ